MIPRYRSRQLRSRQWVALAALLLGTMAGPSNVLAAPAQSSQPESRLSIEVFNAGEDAIFAVSSVLVTGERDAVLIDAQFSAADAKKVADLVKASGKRLTTIYISHGDPDYYFGLDTLHAAFPDAAVVATPQTIAHIQATHEEKLNVWSPQLGDNAPARIIIPQPLSGDTLTLENQSLDIIGLDGPTPERTVVWIPALRTVAGGIPVIGREHVWMADTPTVAEQTDWLATLERITKLSPDVVIPGHFAPGSPLDLRSVQFTADYIRAFMQEAARAKDSAALIAAMQQRYPGLPGESSLALSAKVVLGEMSWH